MIVLLGSGEFTPAVRDLDRNLIARHGGRVCVLPWAADGSAAEHFASAAASHFAEIGGHVDIVHTDGADAQSAIESANIIYLPGGQPQNVMQSMTIGTLATLRAALTRGTVLAAASAGAMALGQHTLVNACDHDEECKWIRGLELLENKAVIPHYSSRPTEWLGRATSTAPPGCGFIGLDDETALVIDGKRHSCWGSGDVWRYSRGSWRKEALRREAARA
jgi:peptidase E